MKEESLFIAALSILDSGERKAFLDSECPSEPVLRQRVERLLQVHQHASSFLEAPAQPECDPVPAFRELRPDSLVDRYRIVRLLGEGGMGAVYLADQTEPVQRQVALKIIKPGLESPQILMRFEAERQALALLDHPNISKVLDAGTTSSGQPYFVMEWVDGLSITEYCDTHRLHPRARLELLITSCQAVQHAHQKGLIHRDIKPSNILVAEVDGKPVPKVIDFGVAKAMGGGMVTQPGYQSFVGTLVGTLEYMSPEQAQLNQQQVDTRTDVYSLGVMLYELLTGSTPHLKVQLKEADIDEALRMIREVDPPKPSTRLSSLHDTLTSISSLRLIEPRQLTRLVQGELDWIVMKALEKDPDRRYPSPLEMSRDLERYLVHEPILAGPPSQLYRFQKFVRRNRMAVAAAALVLLTLLAGIIGTGYGIIEARASRRVAELRYEMARNSVNQFLDSVTDDPDLNRADLSGLRGQLLSSATSYYQQLAEQNPQNTSQQWDHALALHRLGLIRYYRGEFTQAEKDFLQARDELQALLERPTESARARMELGKLLNMLGIVHCTMGYRAESISDHRASEKLLSQSDAAGENDPASLYHLALTRSNLAFELGKGDQLEESRKLYLLSLDNFQSLAKRDPENRTYRSAHALVVQNYAELLDDQGNLPQAIEQITLSVKMLEKLVGEANGMGHRRNLAASLASLSRFLNKTRKPSEAIPLATRAKSMSEELVRDFPSAVELKIILANTCHQLGWAHQQKREWLKAVPAYEQACSIREKLLSNSPTVPSYLSGLWQAYINLGMVLHELQQKDLSLTAFSRAKTHLEKAFRLPNSSIRVKDTLRIVILNISQLLADQSKYDEAMREIEQADALAPSRECTLWRAAILVKLGRHQEAVQTAVETCKDKEIKPVELFSAALVCSLAVDELRNSGAEAVQYRERGKELLSRVVGKASNKQLNEFMRSHWPIYWVSSRTQLYKTWLTELESTLHSVPSNDKW